MVMTTEEKIKVILSHIENVQRNTNKLGLKLSHHIQQIENMLLHLN